MDGKNTIKELQGQIDKLEADLAAEKELEEL